MEKELGLMDKLVIGKNVYGHLDTIRMSDSVDVTTNHNEMRNATYDLIGLINQLDTNANVVNQSELEETEVYDEVPINRINNLSMNKGLIEDKLRYYGV